MTAFAMMNNIVDRDRCSAVLYYKNHGQLWIVFEFKKLAIPYMSILVSFGSDSIKNGSSVNKNSVGTSPTVVFQDMSPGYYTITMMGIDVPYVHWIKCNVISNGTRGSIVANYSGPAPNALDKRRYLVSVWRQTTGRLSPPPRAPLHRNAFNLDRFVSKNGLLYVASIAFLV
jgi:phosphatidylethanolamine-binding protein (PEBP) family uncharacterized protein